MQRLAFLKRITLLACVLQGQSGFVPGALGAGYTYAQLPLSENGYRATCEKIATSLSSASQVFYPGENVMILVVIIAYHG